jgi:hypothetical protein
MVMSYSPRLLLSFLRLCIVYHTIMVSFTCTTRNDYHVHVVCKNKLPWPYQNSPGPFSQHNAHMQNWCKFSDFCHFWRAISIHGHVEKLIVLKLAAHFFCFQVSCSLPVIKSLSAYERSLILTPSHHDPMHVSYTELWNLLTSMTAY